MIVIGVGNRDRGDDAVGPCVVDRLGDSVTCYESDGDPSVLITLFGSDSDIVIVDATVTGRPAGTVSVTELPLSSPLTGSLPLTQRGSTHGFGVIEALELARILGEQPARVTVIGIEVEEFGHHNVLTESAQRAVDAATDLVMRWVAEADAPTTKV